MADKNHEILLHCSILGRDVGRVFSVHIPPSKSLCRLKATINQKKKRELEHVAAPSLHV
jgi:hypothetical protein